MLKLLYENVFEIIREMELLKHNWSVYFDNKNKENEKLQTDKSFVKLNGGTRKQTIEANKMNKTDNI